MLALIYLALMIAVGDSLCRRFYAFRSLPVRFAAAFLSGLVLSGWVTYLAAWIFSGTASPMAWGNLAFFIMAVAGVFLLYRFPADRVARNVEDEPSQFDRGDWITFAAIFLLVTWMMFSTMNMSGGKVEIANQQWSDFGSNVSIIQSFALGDNFPTEYPHFSGERIRYHFLFYFVAGDLEYLGLNPALANNILSILSMVSMLVLVWALGVVLFASRAVGRIAAGLFFFHGSLAFIPYIISKGSLSATWASLWTTRDFLASPFDYRGELWGVWSQVVFLNQRHFATSIGVLVLVLVVVSIRYKETLAARTSLLPEPGPEPVGGEEETTVAGAQALDGTDIVKRTAAGVTPEEREAEDVTHEDSQDQHDEPTINVGDPADQVASDDPQYESHELPPTPTEPWYMGFLLDIQPYIFSGLLLGLLPLWNGPVFLAAAVVLGILLVALPVRKPMLVMGIIAGVVALPQVLFLRGGNMRPAGYSLWHWGYTINDPSFLNVAKYLGFTFGLKWLLIAIGLYFCGRLGRTIFAAAFALIWVAFCFQFSDEVLANHKFLNIFLVIANAFVGYGFYRLWSIEPPVLRLPSRILAIILAVFVTLGGFMDLFPIHNGYWMQMPFYGDPLIEWLQKNTDPRAVFLSHRYVNHGLLLAGRKLFYGHPYYSWSAGYDTDSRDKIYKRMLEGKDPKEVFDLLKQNNITYVAIDDQLRNDKEIIRHLNEPLFQAYCDLIYDDVDNKYDHLKIYKVPDVLGQPKSNLPALPSPTPSPDALQSRPTNPFVGEEGSEPGQLKKPRGLATDQKGFIYVADTQNSRIQKFDRDGNFVISFGTPGAGPGEMKEPNGVAVDIQGNIFVSDAADQKLLKFGPRGEFIKEWSGPETGFYGPRDLAFGPNKMLYIVDQGRTRIVRFDPSTEAFSSWGSSGGEPGQFHESTGIAIGGGYVFVADAGNNRIEVFDLTGAFIREWDVEAWQHYIWHYPDLAYDEQSKRLFVTSGWSHEILIYDIDGKLLGNIKPPDDQKLTNASAIVIDRASKPPRLLVLDTDASRLRSFTDAALQ